MERVIDDSPKSIGISGPYLSLKAPPISLAGIPTALNNVIYKLKDVAGRPASKYTG